MNSINITQDFAQGNVKKAMAEAGATSGDLWRVPVGDLNVLPGLNVRVHNEEYDAHVQAIADSIFSEGFYPDKALAVFIGEDGKIFVRDGHSRLEAAKKAIAMGAQITVLPCVTAPKGSTMEDFTVGLIKSNTGKPLLPIEVAAVCKRLVGWGWDAAKIGERFGYTTPYVNDLLGLLSAPAAVQALVSSGKASASTAIKAMKREGPTQAAASLVAASKASPNGKVTPKAAKAASGGLKPPAERVRNAKPSKPVTPTESNLLKALKAVLDDAHFNKLSDRTQNGVLEFVG